MCNTPSYRSQASSHVATGQSKPPVADDASVAGESKQPSVVITRKFLEAKYHSSLLLSTRYQAEWMMSCMPQYLR
uniref:Uncharacterized protein n=1 Tax=Setaria viridis TaxID=4556 RepID=A0A4U6VE01_SETVI|nr:hypothetical protein SEVIR_3G165900v2 [Setaria viridis]